MGNSTGVLYVVLDTSGSMHEIAKLHIAMNLVSHIREGLRMKIYELAFTSLTMVTCSDDIQVYKLAEDEELPSFKASGKINFEKLIKFLELEGKYHNTKQGVIIISDGNFSSSSLQSFLDWRAKQDEFYVRVIAIGVDAEILNLKEISSEGTVYFAEDINSALKPWFNNANKVSREPVSLKDIIFKTEEDEVDEWD